MTHTPTDVEREIDAAWEQDKDIVAALAHDAWMRQKLADGFADHPFVPGLKPGAMVNHCLRDCEIHESKHHPDMVPFEQLSERDKAYDYATGKDAYVFGYLAALRKLFSGQG